MSGHDDHLLPYLLAQRWYGDKGRDVELAGVGVSTWLTSVDAEPAVRIAFVRCRFADGGRAESVYQVPISYRRAPAENLQHALIGSWDEPDLTGSDGGVVWAYDAMQDKEATAHWLDGIASGRTLDGLDFVSAGAEELTSDPESLTSLAMTGEQSNTSVLFGDVAIFKLFRRIEPGRNPGVEIETALTAEDTAEVPHVFGSVHGRWTATEPGTDSEGTVDGDLGLMSAFQRSSVDGWGYATASVRDLYHEDDVRASRAGGDFAAESHRLGESVARVHTELVSAFGAGSWDDAARRSITADMDARLTEALGVVDELAELEKPLRAVFARIADHEGELPTQRIHGDLHLGQTLRVVDGWRVIDFEGEPAKSIAERREFSSTLRDVAGMLRSFDYVAKSRLADFPDDELVEDQAAAWSRRNVSAFLDGYADAAGTDPRDAQPLLDAFVLDKLVYEVMYEARNRPAWLQIPMAAVRELAG